MAHHNSTVSFELEEKIVLLFQVSHTRKKVIYFPLKCFCIIFLLLFLLAFIFLNQYNRVHEVLCILCVLCCFAPSIHRLISPHLHIMCVQSKMIKLSIFIYFVSFLLGSVQFSNLFHPFLLAPE